MNYQVPSVIKRMTASRWELNPSALYREEVHFIDWRTFLPRDGGDKNQRSYLLRSCRELLLALINGAYFVVGDSAASSTVLNWSHCIRRLVQWMTAKNTWRFSLLSQADLQLYLHEKNVAVSVKTSGAWVNLFRRMFDLRDMYCGSLRVNPYLLSIDDLSQCRDSRRWRALDEQYALPLIKDAIEWVRQYGAYLIELREEIESGSKGWKFLKRAERSRRIRGLLQKKCFAPQFQSLARSIGEDGTRSGVVFRKALVCADAACIVVLLFLVGLRVRELVSLNIDCLEHSFDASGAKQFHLAGVAAKQAGASKRWAITQPVVDVVNFLERAHRRERLLSGSDALIVSVERGKNAVDVDRRIKRAIPTVASKRLKAFATDEARTKKIADREVHPHVARKTFARFVVMRDRTSLEALSYHFGHVHRSVTDGAYVGSDLALEKLLSEESRADLVNCLTDLLTAKNLAGKGAATLEGLRSRDEASFLGKRSLTAMVERLIAQGVQLAPCNWGYCVYSKSLSACHGNENGPNEIERSPDVCAGCQNFVVTNRHEAWWSRRLESDQQFLKRDNLSEQTRVLVDTRLRRTEIILRSLILRPKPEIRQEDGQGGDE